MKCICCDVLVSATIHKPVDDNHTDPIKSEEDAIFVTEKMEYEEGKTTFIRAQNRMWHNGIVGNISAGYGSTLDGNCYVIAICDSCAKKKHLDGTIAFTGDYMNPEYYREHEEEKARQIWRRYNQLDSLLSEESKE